MSSDRRMSHIRNWLYRRSVIRRRGTLAFALAVAVLTGGHAQAAVPPGFFGLTAVSPTSEDFADMARLGAGSHRLGISWPEVQKTPGGPFNWSAVDGRVQGAAAAGLELTLMLFGNPLTAPGDAYTHAPVGTEAQKQGWRDFVIATLGRYGDGGRFWRENPHLHPRLAPDKVIVWNEPNSYYMGPITPAKYAALLRITRRAVSAASPDTEIITGGVYGYPGGDAMDGRTFLRRVYSRPRAKGIIDGVSVHPYSGTLVGVRRQLKDARRVIQAAHDDASIVIGETGWSTGGPKFSRLVKSRRQQADLLERAYGLFLRKRRSWKISAAYWYHHRDVEQGTVCIWCHASGLRDKQGQLKPAGRAYRELARSATR